MLKPRLCNGRSGKPPPKPFPVPSLLDGNVRITIPVNQSTADLANQYLANVNSFAPVALTYLTNTGRQDVVTWNVVPEPGSLGLVAFSDLAAAPPPLISTDFPELTFGLHAGRIRSNLQPRIAGWSPESVMPWFENPSMPICLDSFFR